MNGLLEQIDSTKALVKADAESLLVNAQTELNATKELIQAAPKTKAVKAELDVVQSELTACEMSLLEVSGTIEKGYYLSAQEQANTTAGQIGALKNQVQHIISGQVAQKAR